MTHKSHLALILWISLGHESTASGLLTDLRKPSLFYYYYHYAV